MASSPNRPSTCTPIGSPSAVHVIGTDIAGFPVMWTVTSRWIPNEPLDELIAASDGTTTITHIELGPLALNDIDDIASDLLGGEPPSEIRNLLDRVGGNPFWAVQVIEGLARRYERGQDAGDLHVDLSMGVRARIGGLSGPAGALVRLAAVWGRGLSVADAGALLGSVSEAQVGVLAREGVDVVINGRHEAEVMATADAIRQNSRVNVTPVVADVTTPEGRDDLLKACPEPDILINNELCDGVVVAVDGMTVVRRVGRKLFVRR